MSLKVQAADGVKVYSISGGKSLPEWLKEKKSRRALMKDTEFRNRLELIQVRTRAFCGGLATFGASLVRIPWENILLFARHDP